MKFIYLVFLCVMCTYSYAQTNSSIQPAERSDSIITKVELESSFPGGDAGWRRFLEENLVYPKKAIKKNIESTVIARFIVDKDGTISDIDAIAGPELLPEAAIDVIKKSPKWNSAYQHGSKVKSYKNQPITFKLQ